MPPLTSSRIIFVLAIAVCQGFGFDDNNPPFLLFLHMFGGV